MATIKTINIDGIRRVITKVNGETRRVSCSCCEACCMYPAAGLAGDFYSASDLPDEVTILGITYLRNSTSYGNTTNGILFEDDVWAKYTNSQRSEQSCLISNGVFDEFLESYTIELDYLGEDSFIQESVVVYRESLCQWIGEDQCGLPVNLYYLSIDGSVEGSPSRLAQWFIDAGTNTLRDEAPCSAVGQSITFNLIKQSPQNSPNGIYGDFDGGVGAIVT